MQRYVGVDLGIATPHKAKVFDAMEPRGPLFEFDLSPEGLERLLAQATEERDAHGSGPLRHHPEGAEGQ